jgi:hypothetical protein
MITFLLTFFFYKIVLAMFCHEFCWLSAKLHAKTIFMSDLHHGRRKLAHGYQNAGPLDLCL